MFAGFFVVLACISAWIALFGQGLIGKEKRGILLRVVLVAAAVGATAATVTPAGVAQGWFTAFGILAIGVIGVETAFLLMPGRRALLPLFAGACTLFAAPFLSAFSTIAHRRWGEVDLAVFHVLFIVMCPVLAAALWLRWFRRTPQGRMISATATFVSLLCLVISFVWSVPRNGDEVTMLWFLLVPVFALAAFILFMTCTSFLILSAVPFIERCHARRADRYEYRRQLPVDTSKVTPSSPQADAAVVLDLRECARCNTRGVLPTSDGRCPNCKQPLEGLEGT